MICHLNSIIKHLNNVILHDLFFIVCRVATACDTKHCHHSLMCDRVGPQTVPHLHPWVSLQHLDPVVDNQLLKTKESFP